MSTCSCRTGEVFLLEINGFLMAELRQATGLDVASALIDLLESGSPRIGPRRVSARPSAPRRTPEGTANRRAVGLPAEVGAPKPGNILLAPTSRF
jgi:hypothetical protein